MITMALLFLNINFVLEIILVGLSQPSESSSVPCANQSIWCHDCLSSY